MFRHVRNLVLAALAAASLLGAGNAQRLPGAAGHADRAVGRAAAAPTRSRARSPTCWNAISSSR